MGTVNNIMIKFYQNCIKALKDIDYHVIMSVGQNTDISKIGEIPSNFEIHESVDQIAVLQKADAFITHCGMNSVNEALYYEVPLVLFPQTNEQGVVARRVSDLEAGIYLKRNHVEEIKNSVITILTDTKYKENASKISAGFKTSGGAPAAADAILKVISSDK